MLVENRAGAGGTLALDNVAKSAADGYSIAFGHVGGIAIAPALFKTLPFDPMRDLVPVSLAVNGLSVLVVTPTLPVKTVADLIAHAKANPGKLASGCPDDLAPLRDPRLDECPELLGRVANRPCAFRQQLFPYQRLPEQCDHLFVQSHHDGPWRATRSDQPIPGARSRDEGAPREHRVRLRSSLPPTSRPDSTAFQ